MKMPVKASIALPWAQACLAQRGGSQDAAYADHMAACNLKIEEIMSEGRRSLCGLIPYSRAQAEYLFRGDPWTTHGYTRHEYGDYIYPTFDRLKVARNMVMEVGVMIGKLTAAGDRKVILDDAEFQALTPFVS